MRGLGKKTLCSAVKTQIGQSIESGPFFDVEALLQDPDVEEDVIQYLVHLLQGHLFGLVQDSLVHLFLRYEHRLQEVVRIASNADHEAFALLGLEDLHFVQLAVRSTSD